jgi:tetratricopeptide (TPR) repeat protein
MAYAHSRRVIHRDLKPQNILIGRFGETVVVDWGLAKDLAAAEPDDGDRAEVTAAGFATSYGTVVGTPAYMSPEQARGETVDERGDVYALGALLYHLLVGAPPFTGRDGAAVLRLLSVGEVPPLHLVPPRAPDELRAIVRKAMAPRAEDRYRSAGELAEELQRFQTGQLVRSHHYSWRRRARRWLARHRGLVGGAAAACAIAVIAVVAWRELRARDATIGQLEVGLRSSVVSWDEHLPRLTGILDPWRGSRAATLESVIEDQLESSLDLTAALAAQDEALRHRQILASRPAASPYEPTLVMAGRLRRALILQTMGELDVALGDLEQIVDEIDRATGVLADSPSHLALRGRAGLQAGRILSLKGDRLAGQAAYEQAIRDLSTASMSFLTRGRGFARSTGRELHALALLEQGAHDRALLAAEGALEQHNHFLESACFGVAQIWNTIGHIHVAANDRAEARAAFEHQLALGVFAIELGPDDVDPDWQVLRLDALTALAALALRDGDLARLVTHLESIDRIVPELLEDPGLRERTARHRRPLGPATGYHRALFAR